MKKIAVIDYGMGNLHSVMKGLSKVRVPAVLTDKPAVIKKCAGILLPGVGAFKDAMKEIKNRKLLSFLKKQAAGGVPFMGICLGMQLLFDESEEFGKHSGLGLIKGAVRRFEGKKLKIPHMGWNQGKFEKKSLLMKGIKDDYLFYFVHSYRVIPEDKKCILTSTEYGGVKFASSVEQGNVCGFQFHPEKSGEPALKIYGNFYRKCVEKASKEKTEDRRQK